MKKTALVLFVLLIFVDVSISSIPPSPYKATEKNGNINSDVSGDTGIKTITVSGDPAVRDLAKVRMGNSLLDTVINPGAEGKELLPAWRGDFGVKSVDQMRQESILINQQEEATRRRLEEEQRRINEERRSSLWIISILCVAFVISLFLIWRFIIWVFNTVNRATKRAKLKFDVMKLFLRMNLDHPDNRAKIGCAVNMGKIRVDEMLEKLISTFNRGKKRVVQKGIDSRLKALGGLGMIQALKQSQEPAIKIDSDLGLELALTDEEIKSLIHFTLFKKIANEYQSKGMSKWGGLAWFCGECVSVAINKKNMEVPFNIEVCKTYKKLAFTAIKLAASAHNLELTPADLIVIGFACEKSSQLIDSDPITKGMDLLMKELEEAGVMI